MTTTTNPPVNTQTHMSEYRGSSATPTSPIITEQAVMKEKIFEELKSATFTVDLTARGGSLQANPDDVQIVVDSLQHNYSLTCGTLISTSMSTVWAPRFPPNGFRGREKESYQPFKDFLNIVVHVANTSLTHASYLKDLHFDVHDAEMGDKLDSRRPLKPDILGLRRTLDGPKTLWDDVAVIVEVKDNMLDLVKQLATYARNHLSLNRRRSFSIAIAFDHRKLTLCFICFHRSGVSASKLLNLKNEDGFRSVIEHMVGILSIRDEAGFGLDMTHVKGMHLLNGRYYAIIFQISRSGNPGS
ncbi:hypothetical protein EDB84DRAFT_126792 [Lactarius hengduanensis]|nr:hypothetical protein EDB84DRAFT_126792 [Lactarius hengduanensis]